MRTGICGANAFTADNILFGAGTVHENLTYDESRGEWDLEDTVIGATSGGCRLRIEPEYADIPVDGALVGCAGLKTVTGVRAFLEVSLCEITPSLLARLLNTGGGSSSVGVPVCGPIPLSGYAANVAFAGVTTGGRKVVAVLENALCVSGFELATADRTPAVLKAVFESHAPSADSADRLPVRLYFD